MKVIPQLLLILSISCCPTLATFGLDVSQLISEDAFECLYENHGYRFAVVRAFHSYGQPDSNALQNIRNAKAAGFDSVDVYMFPCYKCGNVAEQVQSLLDSLSPVDGEYGKIWLDIEGSQYWSNDATSNLDFIKELYNAVQSFTHHPVGIYSSYYNWNSLTGNSDYFAKLGAQIWYAHYDGEASFSDWTSLNFGGWTTPFAKQYQGTSAECGVGIDKNWHP